MRFRSLVLLPAFSLALYGVTIDLTVSGFSPAERRVLDRAVGYWEGAIPDLFAVDVSVSMLDLPGDYLGTSSGLVEDAGTGLPAGAVVEVDNRAGSIFPWFVDPTPELDEEFTPGETPYHRRGLLSHPSGSDYDLLTVLLHELGHVLGFSIQYTRFAANVGPSDLGDLRSYSGSTVTAYLAPEYDGTHVSDAVYPYDLMTAFQGRGARLYPSDLDLAILSDAYGYAAPLQPVPEPSTALLGVAGGLLCLAHRWREGRRA